MFIFNILIGLNTYDKASQNNKGAVAIHFSPNKTKTIGSARTARPIIAGKTNIEVIFISLLNINAKLSFLS